MLRRDLHSSNSRARLAHMAGRRLWRPPPNRRRRFRVRARSAATPTRPPDGARARPRRSAPARWIQSSRRAMWAIRAAGRDPVPSASGAAKQRFRQNHGGMEKADRDRRGTAREISRRAGLRMEHVSSRRRSWPCCSTRGRLSDVASVGADVRKLHARRAHCPAKNANHTARRQRGPRPGRSSTCAVSCRSGGTADRVAGMLSGAAGVSETGDGKRQARVTRRRHLDRARGYKAAERRMPGRPTRRPRASLR